VNDTSEAAHANANEGGGARASRSEGAGGGGEGPADNNNNDNNNNNHNHNNNHSMLKAICAQKADVPKLKNITANASSTPVFSREETPGSQRTKSEDMYSSDDDVPLASKYVSSYYSIYLASSYCCISSVRIL
jgi:hypothetical protein